MIEAIVNSQKDFFKTDSLIRLQCSISSEEHSNFLHFFLPTNPVFGRSCDILKTVFRRSCFLKIQTHQIPINISHVKSTDMKKVGLKSDTFCFLVLTCISKTHLIP